MSPIDDRISSQEVHPSAHRGGFVDIYGRAWGERPDEKVRNQVRKLEVDADTYWKIEKLLTERDWMGLDEYFIGMKDKRESGDDLKRIEAARKVVLRQLEVQRSDEEL
jgi:hypothetical protein